MKQQILNKTLFFCMLSLILTKPMHAQMLDLMGSMAVGGSQTVGSVRSVGQMNNAFKMQQFINALQLKNAEISTTYIGNYQNMKIQSININGVKAVFQPVNEGHNYQAFISPVTQQFCQKLSKTPFDNLVMIRAIDNGSSSDFSVRQARSNSDFCITTDALSLVFE